MARHNHVEDYTIFNEISLKDCRGVPVDITFREAAAVAIAAGVDGRYLSPRLLELTDGKRLSDIDQALIKELAQRLLPLAASSTHNRQVYTPISAVLKFSAARGWCRYFRINRPRHQKPDVVLPSSAELDRFTKAAGPSLKRVIRFLRSTGMTVRETLELDWTQVDLTKRRLRLTPKRDGSERLIVLDLDIVEMLARFLHRTGRVFRRPDGRPYAVKHDAGGLLKSAFRGASDRAGVERITPRTLRRVWENERLQSHLEGGCSDAA